MEPISGGGNVVPRYTAYAVASIEAVQLSEDVSDIPGTRFAGAVSTGEDGGNGGNGVIFVRKALSGP